jgi:glycosyltransferase involved in cell wall biosynthesis
MDEAPLVSIIVPTKNSERFLDRCLSSLVNQTYRNIEIIVVDNYSTDRTIEIAKKYTNKIFQFGPERSAQVNFGSRKASGDYLYKVDSDFVLSRSVVEECVEIARTGFDAVIVHNTPDTTISLIAEIRKFEVDMYKYNLTYSSARFVKKDIFVRIGGFNERITAGEDYDFQNRLNKLQVKTGFIESEAIHLGEPTSLGSHLRKIYSYGKDFINFRKYNKVESKNQLSPLRGVYFRNWRKFVSHPLTAIMFIFYTFIKFLTGFLGYCVGLMGLLAQK